MNSWKSVFLKINKFNIMIIYKLTFFSKLSITGFIITVLPLMAISQINVLRINDSKSVSEKVGVIYSLPQTVFHVSLTINKIQKIKGPYSEFADKYLGLSNCINTNSTEYEIKELSISTATEPDPDQYYFVELDDKGSKEGKAIEMYLSESGMLQDAKEVSKLKNPKITSELTEHNDNFTEILNPSWFERVDTIIRRVSVDTTTIEQKVFRKASTEKTTEQKAKDAADYILKLDENKLNLMSGYQEIAYEKASLEYMCSHLDKQKEEYLALFKGLISITGFEMNFSFVPKTGEAEQTAILCKFSKMKGVAEKSGAGDPISIVIETEGLTKALSDYLKTQNKDEKRSHGFYYRIPDAANVYLKIGGQTKLEANFPVNQLGIVTSAPTGNFSSLRLHENSGSLKSLILE
jgi:hypothetical protein